MSMLPRWLEGPFNDVLRDLQKPRPVPLQIEWQPGAEGESSYVWFTEPGERGKAGMGVTPMESAEDLKVHIAEWLQDQWFPETAGAWAQARPECPGHGHPAQAYVVDGVAVWACPRDGRVLAPVGEL